jgi:hypothetical protein
MDDDIMDEQKHASAAMVLAKALVDQETATDQKKPESQVQDITKPPLQAEQKSQKRSEFAPRFDENGNHTLPYRKLHCAPDPPADDSVPVHLARQVQTRADFLQSYDADNIFAISAEGMVRADSVPMMTAFRTICKQPGFAKFLQDTLDRIGDIESLGRTREITIKDLWDGGKYQMKVLDSRANVQRTIEFEAVKPEKPEDDDNDEN